MNKSQLVGALSAFAMYFSVASPVNAAFVLTIDDLSNGVGIDVTVSDLDADGVVSFNGAIGAFFVDVVTGISKPAIAGPQLLDLNSINVSGAAGGLIISLTDTDYSGTPPALTGLFGGTSIGSVDFNFLFDDSNGEFAGLSFFDPLATTTASFDGAGTSVGAPSAPYSLTIVAEISHSGSGVTSFDAEIRAVPVPAAVWLFGSGLLGLVGIARRTAA